MAVGRCSRGDSSALSVQEAEREDEKGGPGQDAVMPPVRLHLLKFPEPPKQYCHVRTERSNIQTCRGDISHSNNRWRGGESLQKEKEDFGVTEA